MDFTAKRGFAKRVMNSQQGERVVATRARALAPIVAKGTPVRSGSTQRSTRAETGHRSAAGDRPSVWIVQEGHGTKQQPGAPVPQEFRQTRDYMLRAIASGGS